MWMDRLICSIILHEHDVNDIRSLYELIDHNKSVTNLMDAKVDPKSGNYPVKVKLGSELPNDY